MAGELSRKQEIRAQVEHCCCWGMAVPHPVVCCGWALTPDSRLRFLQEVGRVFHGSSRVLGSSRSPGCLWVCRWMGGASVPAMALTSMPPCSTVSISFPLPSLFFYLKELKPEEIF